MVTKSRQQMEDELRQTVRQSQAEFGSAPAVTRHIAEQRLLDALQVFTAFVIDGRLPDKRATVLGRHSSREPRGNFKGNSDTFCHGALLSRPTE